MYANPPISLLGSAKRSSSPQPGHLKISLTFIDVSTIAAEPIGQGAVLVQRSMGGETGTGGD
jgi:hypothetical protein